MEPLVIDVWADVACPWCRRGQDALDAAISEEPGGSVAVRHRAFELRPGTTRVAHQLIKLAETEDEGAVALRALYGAALDEGLEVGEPGVAVAVVAGATGLSARALRAAVDEGGGELELMEDLRLAERLELRAVPFYLAGASVALSGFHEPADLRRLIAAGRERVEAAHSPGGAEKRP